MDSRIKTFSERLKNVLINGGSINNLSFEGIDEDIWSSSNFTNLQTLFYESGRSAFAHDYKRRLLQQIENAPQYIEGLSRAQHRAMLLLAIELISVYGVFSDLRHEDYRQTNILERTLRHKISMLINMGLSVSVFPASQAALQGKSIDQIAREDWFNKKNQLHGQYSLNVGSWDMKDEIPYLTKVFKEWYESSISHDDRARYMNLDPSINHRMFELITTKVAGKHKPRSQKMLLYLLFSDNHHPFASLK